MPENGRAATGAELAIDARRTPVPFQGADGGEVEGGAVKEGDVGFGDEDPGLDVEAGREAAGGAGAGAAEVLGAVFAEPPAGLIGGTVVVVSHDVASRRG